MASIASAFDAISAAISTTNSVLPGMRVAVGCIAVTLGRSGRAALPKSAPGGKFHFLRAKRG